MKTIKIPKKIIKKKRQLDDLLWKAQILHDELIKWYVAKMDKVDEAVLEEISDEEFGEIEGNNYDFYLENAISNLEAVGYKCRKPDEN